MKRNWGIIAGLILIAAVSARADLVSGEKSFDEDGPIKFVESGLQSPEIEAPVDIKEIPEDIFSFLKNVEEPLDTAANDTLVNNHGIEREPASMCLLGIVIAGIAARRFDNRVHL